MAEKAVEELDSIKRITEGLSKLDKNRQYMTSIITSDSQALCIIYMFKVYKYLILTWGEVLQHFILGLHVAIITHAKWERTRSHIYVD